MIQDNPQLRVGHIDFFNNKKNLGMVGSDGGVYYFHYEDLRDQDLRPGDHVSFQVRKSLLQIKDIRLFAKNIRRIENDNQE